MKKITGKTYQPFDNSYSLAISKENSMHGVPDFSHDFLAGSQIGHSRKICKILTEPFKMNVNTCSDEKTEQTFIIVEHGGEAYTTLYRESSVL